MPQSANTHHPTRSLPMKVLALGMGRTGTTSLAEALRQLGFSPYDYPDRAIMGHLHLWSDAIRAKYYNKGPKWGVKEFDQITQNFDAILDVPCCLFVDELLAAYPAAKVILNTRDPDEWLESVQKSLFAMFAWPSWRILKYTDPYGCGRYREHDRLIWAAFCGHDPGERCRQAFIEHNNYVKKVVPPDKLLVYEINEGWRPLCRFLDVPVPEMPFPYTNSLPSFFMYLGGAWRMFVWRSIRNVVVVLGIVAMGYWLLRKGLYLF